MKERRINAVHAKKGARERLMKKGNDEGMTKAALPAGEQVSWLEKQIKEE